MSGTQITAESLVDLLDRVLADGDLVDKLHHGPARYRLRDLAGQLSMSMETQADSINRIRDTPLQLAMAKVGVDKPVFKVLAEAGRKALTNAELADKTGIDPVLLKKMLRYWQACGNISNPGDDAYAANNVTEALASVQGRTALNHNFLTMVPVFNAIPEWFEENGYKLITDYSNTPFQLGHKTKLEAWAWGQEKPERYETFLAWMTNARNNLPVFIDLLDIEEYFQNSEKDTVLFLDISGSRGHITTKLRQRYAHVPGRVVLQDQDYVIAAAKKEPLPGFDKIETLVHDFFSGPTPIKGARVYYLRNILHDWSDQKCLEILASVRPSMVASQSVLIIDELIVPEVGASLREAQLDIDMLVHTAGAERTEKEFRQLLSDAGFDVKRVRQYGKDRNDGLIEAVLK